MLFQYKFPKSHCLLSNNSTATFSCSGREEISYECTIDNEEHEQMIPRPEEEEGCQKNMKNLHIH